MWLYKWYRPESMQFDQVRSEKKKRQNILAFIKACFKEIIQMIA
jgi:hypothetical protein